MVGKMLMPGVPIARVEEVGDLLRPRDSDGRARVLICPVGVGGQEEDHLAVDALGEERGGFGIEWRDEMPLGEFFWRIADGKSYLYIVGAEGIAPERRIEAVPLAFEEGHAWVFATELVPIFLGRDDLAAGVEVRAVLRKARADGGEAGVRGLHDIWVPERAIVD